MVPLVLVVLLVLVILQVLGALLVLLVLVVLLVTSVTTSTVKPNKVTCLNWPKCVICVLSDLRNAATCLIRPGNSGPEATGTDRFHCTSWISGTVGTYTSDTCV